MKDYLSELHPPRKKSTRIRVCLNVDEGIYKQVRNIQSFLIKETNKNISFSKVVEEVLDIGLNDKKFSDVMKIIIEEKKL